MSLLNTAENYLLTNDGICLGHFDIAGSAREYGGGQRQASDIVLHGWLCCGAFRHRPLLRATRTDSSATAISSTTCSGIGGASICPPAPLAPQLLPRHADLVAQLARLYSRYLPREHPVEFQSPPRHGGAGARFPQALEDGAHDPTHSQGAVTGGRGYQGRAGPLHRDGVCRPDEYALL
ncbi:hypothetical protein [Streptomyces sp. NPDC101150]|uniref:hypothetical protein n=1 Tax=Streptomyces sp. NPDC101150 TaxID=3366114 RepID=UPI0037FC0344